MPKTWKSWRQRDLEKGIMPKTSKDFYRHADTGEVFAIERQWDGTVVGSYGPLKENDLRDLGSYEYTPDKNGWLKDASDKLILCV